jgi:hypothetical protein
MAVGQRGIHGLTLRYRGQAPSHIWNSLILIFYTAVFTRFPLFSRAGCYIVAIEFGNVATGNGHDHST